MSKPNSEKELLKLGPLAYLLYSAHSHFSTCKLAEAPIFFALVTTFPQTHFWSHKHAECIRIGYGYMACAPLSHRWRSKFWCPTKMKHGQGLPIYGTSPPCTSNPSGSNWWCHAHYTCYQWLPGVYILYINFQWVLGPQYPLVVGFLVYCSRLWVVQMCCLRLGVAEVCQSAWLSVSLGLCRFASPLEQIILVLLL